MGLLYFVLMSVCLEVVLTAALPVSSQDSTCQFQGHTVHGDFIQGPCMFCHCSNGQASCALRDCAPPSCRFQTTRPDACCPSCATGNNVLYFGTYRISDGSGVSVHMCRLTRALAARIHKE